MAQLSMNEFTTYRWSLEQDLAAISAAGYDGIGVWRDKVSDYGEAAAVKLIAESGLAVSTLSWAGGFTGADGRRHVDAVEDALDAIRLAHRLNCPTLIVHSGGRGGHTSSHARRMFFSALETLLPVAAAHGVVLALEAMQGSSGADWTFLKGLTETLQVVQHFQTPTLRIAFDTYHVAHDTAVVDQLEEIVPYLAVVQLGDGRRAPQREPNRCRLGSGVLPLEQIVTTLLAAGYDGYFDIELMGEEIEADDYHDLLRHSRRAFYDLLEAAQAR
jgi:sugar phosphate isomerase/epimerase